MWYLCALINKIDRIKKIYCNQLKSIKINYIDKNWNFILTTCLLILNIRNSL